MSNGTQDRKTTGTRIKRLAERLDRAKAYASLEQTQSVLRGVLDLLADELLEDELLEDTE